MQFPGEGSTGGGGIGATAEARLVPLGPLIEYYEREMGALPGRLMIATSFLRDVQLLATWEAQPPELRAAVEQAEALVVSVMVRLLNAEAGYLGEETDSGGQEGSPLDGNGRNGAH